MTKIQANTYESNIRSHNLFWDDILLKLRYFYPRMSHLYCMVNTIQTA